MSTRMMRQLTRTISTKPLSRGLHQRATSKIQAPKPRILSSAQSQARCFSVSRPASKGIQPHSEDPQPKESEAIDDIKNPTPLSDAEYHDRAESLLEEIVAKMESMQEQRDDVDVEYSVCFPKVPFPRAFCVFLPLHSFLTTLQHYMES